MNKNACALTPPMGWNSYDYYDTTVNEEQVKANADYMAKNLKQYGWEYIVIDIEWYAHNAGSRREKYQYIPFEKVEIDEYARLMPCIDRFPSAANGQGFKPLADYVHSLGLKFGIHIMRGIPRIAAHLHMPIKGTKVTANEIADPASICYWNPDMYGVIPSEDGAQEYYNSIFELYARWGVDFIKCDDICRMDASSAKEEIAMLHKAIDKSGRPMVLSLSPGPAKIEEAWYYEQHANMWRITDDFWDSWPLLLNMFARCELWQKHVSPGCYPDLDMLPVGILGKGFGQERATNFTKEEQMTMFTLWCMFRSPMMLGAELTKLDEWTLSLVTKREVLRLLTHSEGARQIVRDEEHAIWYAKDCEEDAWYLAVFNFENPDIFTFKAEDVSMNSFEGLVFHELWTGTIMQGDGNQFICKVPRHGVHLYKVCDRRIYEKN